MTGSTASEANVNFTKAAFRLRALYLVAASAGYTSPRCFVEGCPVKDHLQLAHREYVETSPKGSGKTMERAKEAIEVPERFKLLCFDHHLAESIELAIARGLPRDQAQLSHMQGLANNAIINRINERRRRREESAQAWDNQRRLKGWP